MAIDHDARLPFGLAAVLVAGLALATTGSSAQSPLTSADGLRPLYATSSDVAEGKKLADLSCSKCHGADGVSTTKGIPNLAGQRPSYLYLALKADQGADRSGSDEPHRMKFLGDDALANAAAYYGSLDPAPPPDTPAPKWADPIAAGKIAAESCAKCHGEDGVSHKAGVPSLVGLHPNYLVESMQSYKSGDRPIGPNNEDMKKALNALSDQDLGHIALYYALQSENLTRAQTPSDDGAPVTKEAVAACAKCHGEAGFSTTPITPSLAGQDAAYALDALRAYKDGTRDDDTMSPKAKKLDDAEMKGFAVYFAGLDPKPVNILKPLSPTEWAEKCDRCHGVNGNSTRPEVPALAAQRQDYLEAALRKFQSGARKSSEMAAMSSILTEEDIAGIAAHYAHQKPRAAVFVMVPSK